jgi:hypothetical protein
LSKARSSNTIITQRAAVSSADCHRMWSASSRCTSRNKHQRRELLRLAQVSITSLTHSRLVSQGARNNGTKDDRSCKTSIFCTEKGFVRIGSSQISAGDAVAIFDATLSLLPGSTSRIPSFSKLHLCADLTQNTIRGVGDEGVRSEMELRGLYQSIVEVKTI